MKSKSIFFVPVILIILQLLLVLTGCQDLNNPKQATININLDLSKLIKESRSQTTQGSSEYILKILAYDATLYKTGGNIEKLPLLIQTENKVDTNGIVKTRLNLEIGLNVIFVAKLFEDENENPLYAGKSEIVKIKQTGNKVNLVLTKVQGDVDFDFSIHEHTFAKEWSMDKTHHWKWSTCGHDVVGEKAEHAMGEYVSNNDATSEKDGTKTKKCTVCNYAETVIDEGTKEHSHTFEDNWTNDATHHWKKSTCGHDVVNENTEHSFTEYVSNKDATTESDGTKTRNCTICGYVETVIDEGSKIVVPEGLRTGDYVLTDKTYVRKEYFSELTQEEREKIFGIVLITDSNIPLILGTQFSTNESKWTASSVGINTYLSEIATGVNGNLNSGYTFTGDLDGSDNWEYICCIDAENTEEFLMAEKYPAFYKANIYAYYAGLTDTDFADNWYIPAINELYEVYKDIDVIKDSLANLGITLPSDNTNFWSSSVPTAFGTTAYKLDYHTGEITNVDRGTNSNYVWVFHKFNNKFNCYEYPEAQITNVEIPTVGEGYTGAIPVTITGKNLLAYEITGDVYGINYVSNEIATGYVDNTRDVGNHNVTVNCGNSVYDANLEVIKSFSVGDILFTDGTRIKAEDVKYGIPTEQISKAFAVVAFNKDYGANPVAIGLQKGISLQWASSGTTGYNTNFTEIQGTTTSGDMDGSDNWDYICSVDPTGSANAAANYPAFNFANTYGQTAGLTGTDYEDGWYLPAIAELKTVYDNRHIVAESLSAVGGAETLGSNYYWSSSQCASDYDDACRLGFYDVGVYNGSKDSIYDVLVVQAFNVEEFLNYEYCMPNITSVNIQCVGSYKGDITVSINGNNFCGPDFDINQIYCSKTLSNLTLIDDTKIKATMYYNGYSEDVTVSLGSSSITTTIEKSDAFTDDYIGRIVLSDGSFIEKESYNSLTMKAVAVVAGLKKEGKKIIALGLQMGNNLMWAPKDTTGFNTSFINISSSIPRNDSDGSRYWDYICSVDPTGSADAATNYPAFNFANTYGATAGLTDTEYADGWYLPSTGELYQVCNNKSSIQESLDIVGGSIILQSIYWTSTPDYSENSLAYLISFLLGEANTNLKSMRFNVLVVRDFNAE